MKLQTLALNRSASATTVHTHPGRRRIGFGFFQIPNHQVAMSVTRDRRLGLDGDDDPKSLTAQPHPGRCTRSPMRVLVYQSLNSAFPARERLTKTRNRYRSRPAPRASRRAYGALVPALACRRGQPGPFVPSEHSSRVDRIDMPFLRVDGFRPSGRFSEEDARPLTRASLRRNRGSLLKSPPYALSTDRSPEAARGIWHQH